MNPFSRWVCGVMVVLLTGCSSTSYDWRQSAVLAIPLQPSLQQEVMLARMEQILSSRALSDGERAQLLYERGVLYDSLGLQALARYEFPQALALRQDMPEVFNYLGVYFTQSGQYDAAYEAFDSVLELDPEYRYALLNRGIALYYGGRYKLAQEDLLNFYQDDPDDPYRVLWLYLTESELNKDEALKALRQRYNAASRDNVGWNIVALYLGYMSEAEFMRRLQDNSTDNTSLAEHLSEAYFYLGKRYLSKGDVDGAVSLFKLTMANNVHNFVEHRYAMLELSLLGQGDTSEAN